MSVSVSAFEYLVAEIFQTDSTMSRRESLENVGFMVGYRFIENISSQQRLMGRDPLDLIKFVCKDLWEELFSKKIDKLQTNHRGVFVLSDFNFKWIQRYRNAHSEESNIILQRLLFFFCSFIKGLLLNLGLVTVVTAEPTLSTLPYSLQLNVRVHSTSF